MVGEQEGTSMSLSGPLEYFYDISVLLGRWRSVGRAGQFTGGESD